MITKRGFVLRGSCFCGKYSFVSINIIAINSMIILCRHKVMYASSRVLCAYNHTGIVYVLLCIPLPFSLSISLCISLCPILCYRFMSLFLSIYYRPFSLPPHLSLSFSLPSLSLSLSPPPLYLSPSLPLLVY